MLALGINQWNFTWVWLFQVLLITKGGLRFNKNNLVYLEIASEKNFHLLRTSTEGIEGGCQYSLFPLGNER